MSNLFDIKQDLVGPEPYNHKYKLRLPTHREVAEWTKSNPDYLYDFTMKAGELCIDKSEEAKKAGYQTELMQVDLADNDFVERLLMVTAAPLGSTPEFMRQYIDLLKKQVNEGQKKLAEITAEQEPEPEVEALAKN